MTRGAATAEQVVQQGRDTDDRTGMPRSSGGDSGGTGDDPDRTAVADAALPDRLAGLDEQRRRLVLAAERHLDVDGLVSLVSTFVDTPSPTGDEAPLARLAAGLLADAGLDATTVVMDDRQASTLARLRSRATGGDGRGADLMLYAPIDTLTSGDPALDLPWAGERMEPHLLPRARVLHGSTGGPYVQGLGAGNPKGHAACVVAAATALARAGVPLRGDVVVGLGAGGMPTNALPGTVDDRSAPAPAGRSGTGHGVGCTSLLEQGGHPDLAVIAKPGWSASYEEVGLAWFDVRVHGDHTYVGSRHRIPYRSAALDAARVVQHLERWFGEYSARHTDGLVAPQGVVAAVEGGWPRMLAVTPAVVRVLVDLRLSPRTSPTEARRELEESLEPLRADGVRVDVVPLVAVPGTTTAPDHPVVRAVERAWEAVEGRPHEPQTGMSGATDANVLRLRGVPTVRVGMPKVDDPALEPNPVADFGVGMNTVDVAWCLRLARLLVRVAVDVCTRSREEFLVATREGSG